MFAGYLPRLSVAILSCATITHASKMHIDISASDPGGIKSVVSLEIFHEQLPLPVPCYDLPPVIEFAVGPREARLRAPPTPLG